MGIDKHLAEQAKARMLAGKKDPGSNLRQGRTSAVSAKAASVSEGTYAPGTTYRCGRAGCRPPVAAAMLLEAP